MSTIFVSHSSKDNQPAQDFTAWLKQLGHHSIFLDFDPADGIPAGRNWEKELYRQVSRCQAVILLCSEYSMASDWCFVEMILARVRGKHLFPVKIAPCSLRPQLTELQVIDFTTNKEEGFDRLKRGLESAGLDPFHSFPPDRPPYPGLMALQEEDAAIFFGRDDDLNKAMGLLNRHRVFGGVRLLLLVGSSGCGKSSLLRAGLVPRLRRDRESWLLVGPIRPADRPLDNLTQALTEAFAKLGDERRGTELRLQLRQALNEEDSRALIDISRELLDTAGKREASVLFMIDQFEELLEGGPAGEAAGLLKLLRTPLQLLDSPVMVLGTLRLDFLAQLQEQSSLRGLRFESLPLGPLSEEGFTQVIERPAELVGLELEPRLVRQLVNDTETQDALPLLAFTLRELWQRWSESASSERDRITLYDYQALGGLEKSVALAAEAVLAAQGLSDEQVKGLLRDPFVCMVRIDEEGRYARRVVRWADIPEASHPLLNRFVEKRLLVSSSQVQMPEGQVVTEVQNRTSDAAIAEKQAEPTLEVAHEALFRTWVRVRSWLDEDLEDLRLRETIRRATEEWKRHDEKPDLLIHHGARLENAENLRRQRRFALGEVEKRYLDACVSSREAERKKKKLMLGVIISSLIVVALALAIGFGWKTVGEEKAQHRLATLHWLNGVDERDRKKDYLKAGHHFMQASDLTKNEPQRENGYLAGALLTDQIGLAAIYDSKNPIRTAGFSRGSSEISTWEDNGTAGLLQVWNVDMEQNKTDRRFEVVGKKIRESPKGEWVVVWEQDGLITIRNRHTGQTAREAAHDDNRIPAFSEDERYVLTWQNGAAEFFDLPKARRIAQFQFTHPLQGAEISNTGARVLTRWKGGSAALWKTQGGEKLADIPYPSTICGAAFNKEDSLLLTWAKDGTVALWDLEKTREPVVLPPGAENLEAECRGVVGGRFLGNDGQVLTWNYGSPGALHLWDARNGNPILAFGHRREVRPAVFSSDESQILSWGDDGTARIWSRETGKELCAFGHQGKVRGAAFNRDESLVLTWSEDNTARLWDGRTCNPVGFSLMHGDHVGGASFSDDGRRILTWGDDQVARVWNLAERPRAISFSLSDKEHIQSVFYRESKNQVLAVTTDGVLKIWGEAGRHPQSLPLDPTIRGARFSRDGKSILTWSDDQLQLWNADEGKPLTPLMKHEKSDAGIQGAAFSPDERQVISWGDDHSARIWEAETGKFVETLPHEDAMVSGALISADSTLAMTWSDDKKIRIWSVPGAKLQGELRHDSEVLGAALFNDKSRILSWDGAGALRIWKWRSREVLKTFHHQGATAILGAQLSADEQRVLSWGNDKTARLWNLDKSDDERTPPLTHSGRIKGASFCNQDARILTWSEDGSTRLWDSQNGQPITGSLKDEGQVLGAMVDHGGTWLTTWTDNTVYRLHVAPTRPYPSSSPVLQLEVSTGTQLKADGEIEIFSSKKWLEKREDLRSKLPPSARSR